MAATIRQLLNPSKLRQIVANIPNVARFSTHIQLFSNVTYNPGYSRDPEELFFREDVQQLLNNLTVCDYNVVFRPRKLGVKLDAPTYELMTKEELDSALDKVKQLAKTKLKMPPLLNERKPFNKVLAKNPELQGFDSAQYVFTDITYGVSHRTRKIVVRDPDGTLRDATWEERGKVNQIYFPQQGRELQKPKMFEDEYLNKCLKQEEYTFILDRACVQFEPDDPDYIRVTRKTYDCIDENHHYASLQSTRHFGPMVLHLLLSKRIDDLLCHFLNERRIESAGNLVKLFCLVEANSSLMENNSTNEQLIQGYIKHCALKKSILELAWETYLEIIKQEANICEVKELSN
nr:EOG090X0AW0 [Cyclestheria hislopi]